jgi:hypothetical protein
MYAFYLKSATIKPVQAPQKNGSLNFNVFMDLDPLSG